MRHLRTRGGGPGRLADHPGHQPAGLRLRVQPGELLSLPRRDGELQVVIVEVHNTHRERHLYTLRAGTATAGAFAARWTRSSTSRRSSTWPGATRSGSATSRPGCGSPSTSARTAAPAAHEPRPARRPLTDRTLARHARPPPVRDPEDDRPDPLACPAAVAARRPVPPSRRGRPMTDATIDRRAPALADPLLLAARLARSRSAGGPRLPVGRLNVVLPDGSRRHFGDAGRGAGRGDPLHDRRALAPCSSAARPAPARRTWTGCGPAPTWPASCARRPESESLALSAGWWRAPGPAAPDARPSRSDATRAARAARNIAAHYDLGNDFYRLFLDETMTYSSAVFDAPDQSLADAQRNKYRPMAERAGLRGGHARPGDRLRLGRLRAVCGRRARLPCHVDHDLAGPARPRHGADPRGRAGGPGRASSCATTAT